MNDASHELTALPVAQIFRESCAVLSSITIPLYEGAGGKPKAVGTGFFVQHKGLPFLVSAAHVLKRLTAASLLYYIDVGTVRRVTGELTTNAHTDEPEKDLIDIAAVRLEGPRLPPYPALGVHMWSSSDIPPARVASPSALYAFIGYPATRSRPRPHPPQLIVEPQAYLAQSAPMDEYAKQGLTPSSHRYLVFDRKKSKGLSGEGVSFPKPHGLSGSPVFLLHDESPGTPPTDRFELAGVVTTWRPRERRIVVTGSQLVLGLLDAAA